MKKHLLPQKGNFYKANMHCHSNLSDGQHTPEELKKFYKSQGYSVLSITDHEGLFYHKDLDDENFLTIAGMELEFNEVYGEDFNDWIVTHLCVYKKEPSEIFQIGFDKTYDHPKFNWLHDAELKKRIISKGELLDKNHTPEAINAAIERYKSAGFIVSYNHPRWSRENYPYYSKYKGMNNLEIYNNGTVVGGHDDDNGDIYDDLLALGERCYPVATDDNHLPNDMFGGFIMLSAEALTYENIISAFENGEFYSSCGPLLSEIYSDNGEIYIESTTPLREVRFHTATRHSGIIKGDSIHKASFKPREKDLYVRAECIGADGKKAYTRAYFIDEL